MTGDLEVQGCSPIVASAPPPLPPPPPSALLPPCGVLAPPHGPLPAQATAAALRPRSVRRMVRARCTIEMPALWLTWCPPCALCEFAVASWGECVLLPHIRAVSGAASRRRGGGRQEPAVLRLPQVAQAQEAAGDMAQHIMPELPAAHSHHARSHRRVPGVRRFHRSEQRGGWCRRHQRHRCHLHARRIRDVQRLEQRTRERHRRCWHGAPCDRHDAKSRAAERRPHSSPQHRRSIAGISCQSVPRSSRGSLCFPFVPSSFIARRY
jgi:hypothetical protein